MDTRATLGSMRAPSGRTGASSVIALTATLGLAAASWVAAVAQMHGMDMGVATRLGSFAAFVALWIAMMTAMMLPGAVPAVLRLAHDGVGAVPRFVVSYLAVWVVVGLGVYAVYRPHGYVAAGVVAIAAGVYELTPFKQRARCRCRGQVRSGLDFGLCCVGSSVGLMAMLLAVGAMSVAWMMLIGVVVFAQKVLPAHAVVDILLATAIIGFGALILAAPASVPGLVPPM